MQVESIKLVEETIKKTIYSLGLIGELLMFVIYYQPSLRKLSVSVYFRSMALVGLFKCIYLFTVFKQLFETQPNLSLSHEIVIYVNSLFVPISVWLEVAASFDRFVTISFPMRFRFIQKRLVQRTTVLVLVIYNMGFYVNTITSVWTKGFLSLEDRLRYYYILYLMDLVNSSALPFFLMMLMSVAMFASVLRVHRRMKRTVGRIIGAQNRRLVRDIKFGVTILVLNVLFFIFIGIFRLHKLVRINPFDRSANYFYFLLFESLMMNISEYYYLSNFYVQLAINSVVRSELLKIFTCMVNKIREIPIFRVKIYIEIIF